MSDLRTYPIRRIKRRAGSMNHRIEVALLEEIERLNGRLTTARFLFYRLVDQLVIKKERKGINPRTGKPYVKPPISTMYEVLTHLRWAGVIPLGQIVDDGRAVVDNGGYRNLIDAGREAVEYARFDPWEGNDPPQIWVEDAGTGQILRSVTRRYCVPIVALSGQPSNGLCYDVARTVGPRTRILYLGDWDRGGQRIEQSATERIGALAGSWSVAEELHNLQPKHTAADYMWSMDQLIAIGRLDGPPEPMQFDVERLAVTLEQAKPLDRLTTWKTYADGTRMEVIELQALGQDLIEQMVIDALDAELERRGLPAIEDAEEETQRQRVETLVALDELR